MEEIEVLDRAEISGTTVLVTYSKTEQALAALRAKHEGVVFDLTTTKGDKDARAARLELKTLRTSLEAKRKELKAPVLLMGVEVDTKAESIRLEIVAMETFIDQQIKADEDRRTAEKAEKDLVEALRAQILRDKIANIRACLGRCNGIAAERIAKGINQVELLDVSIAVFAELAPDAELAKSETLAAMRALHAVTTEREADVARVEAQRVENERVAGVLKAQADALEVQQAEINAALKKVEDAKKASAEAIEKAQAETPQALEPLAQAATETVAFSPPTQADFDDGVVDAEVVLTGRMVSVPMKIMSAPATDTGEVISLGQIGERLGFALKADFLKELGFEPCERDKKRPSAILYRESAFPSICTALMHHIHDVCELQAA